MSHCNGGASVAKSCLTLATPQTSLPGSSVHGILQARILEWVAVSFSRVSSQPRNQTWVSCLAGRFLPTELQGKPRCLWVCFIPIKNEGIWPGSREDKPEGNYNNLGEKTHLE